MNEWPYARSAITEKFTKQVDEWVFLYTNLNNKDEFIEHYTIFLSRRLLQQISQRSYDIERLVIQKIKERWDIHSFFMYRTGVLSVSVLESMLNDIVTKTSE